MQELDLSSLQSVRRFAEAWRAARRPLHVLVNNAGIFAMSAVRHFYLQCCEIVPKWLALHNAAHARLCGASSCTWRSADACGTMGNGPLLPAGTGDNAGRV